MNIANKFTTARMIAVPFFIYAYLLDFYFIAFIIFVLAAITDFIDGKLARKLNLTSNYGKIMDPVADKILVYSAFCLLIPEYVKGWMLIVILAREFLISGMRIVAASNGKVIAAGISGKIKTVVQMITVPAFILHKALSTKLQIFMAMDRANEVISNNALAFLSGFTHYLYYFAIFCLYASIVMTVYSGVDYAFENAHVFKD